ncbi:T9SS type A sorting domain-containing protein [bacterium]|nr:T9SS type A sorting domain-containing protein [bacterium]
MKCYVKFILLWVALLLPLTSFAVQPPSTALTTGEYQLIHVTTSPERDEADDDSVVYSYGFEEGWAGWTHMDLTDVGTMWHISEEHAYNEGSSWWCGNEDIGGYDNHWLQYLETPVLDLRDLENLVLEFKLYYNCEDPDHEDMDPPDPEDWPGYDGWDGCNVWISTNGGDEWEVLTPITPEYDYESLFSFGHEWGMGTGIPGWAGFETEWFDAEFDLSEYTEEEVIIRWAFCSDPAWATGDAPDNNREAIGMLVDEMRILAGDDPIWENDGAEVGDMQVQSMGETVGDYWEIADDEGHESQHSAHCSIEMGMLNALVTPPLEIPEEGFYTYFDFWLICNTIHSNSNPDEDTNLDDYFRMEVSDDDGLTWQDLIWDYGHPDQRPDWYEDWAYYGPDTWYGDQYAEWRRKLNMTQFAGETIKLRWVMMADSVEEGDQGTGLWIDDFRLLTTARRESDVGLEWLHIGYPITMGSVTECQLMVKNYGMLTQNDIRKYWRVDDERQTPIIPFAGELGPDSTDTRNFLLQRLPYSGAATLYVYTALGGDEEPGNDLIETEIVIYPEDMHMLGYDDRRWEFGVNFTNVNNGPAVLFTPVDDEVRGNIDLQAIEVLWDSEEQEGEFTTTMHIYDDNRVQLGQELYSRDITVGPDQLYPNVCRINLSDVGELKNLDDDFWVYFNINGMVEDNNFPKILGRRTDGGDYPNWGEGHYFASNGNNVQEADFEFQMRAFITAADAPEEMDLIAGCAEIDFEMVEVDDVKTLNLTMFGGATTPVTIQDVETDNDLFTVAYEGEFPIVLNIGERAVFQISFAPLEEEVFSAHIILDCDDETPPFVRFRGRSTADVSENYTSQPVEFSLCEAYPNPFNATAVIPFSLPYKATVEIALFDLSGRKVAELVSGDFSAGTHEFILNAEDLAAGMYLYRMESASL